jgi:hypothetical protein
VAVLSPTPLEPVTVVWSEFASVRSVPVAMIVPVVVIAPGEYVESVAGMVCPPLAAIIHASPENDPYGIHGGSRTCIGH